MKTLRPLLALAALLCFSEAGRAATPTYNSFNTNQFYTNGASPILININTNFPALVITNIYSSNIYVTNIYATNIYASNIVSADLIWTNANPWIAPFAFTNTFRLNTNGGVFAGQGLSSDSWFFTDESVGFASLHDSSKGDSAYNRFFFGAEDHTSAPTNTAYAWFTTHTGAQPELSALFNATVGQAQSSYFQINLRPDAANANLRLYNQNLLTFAVNDVSGYSGVGDRFLSDDGTYKPGAGTTINPTDGFLPYRLNATAFDDSPMYRIDSTTVGVDTVDANVVAVTNLQSGGVIYSRSDGILTNVVNGTGFLFNDGSNTNLVWSGGSLSDICLWTNKAGLLQPVDLTLPLFWTNKVVLGPGTTNVLFRSGNDLVYTNGAINNVNFEVRNGDEKTTALNVSTGTGAVQTSEPLLGLTAGSKSITVDGTSQTLRPNNAAEMSLGMPGAEWLDLYLTNSIRWGPGATNILYRLGSTLVYTNALPTFTLTNASSYFRLYLSGGSIPTIGGSTTIFFDNDMVTRGIFPDSDNARDIGSNASNGAYKDAYLKGKYYAEGMNDGAGNYSRLSLSHTGTNGAIVFDSQSAGTAGLDKNFIFTNSTAATTEIKLWNGKSNTTALFRVGSDHATLDSSTDVIYMPVKVGIGVLAPKIPLEVTGPMLLSVSATALTAPATIIGAGSCRIELLSDDNAPANRLFTLNTNAYRGQEIVIYVASNAAKVTNNSPLSGGSGGVIKLASDWSGTTWSSLTLLSDGTNLIETARSIK